MQTFWAESLIYAMVPASWAAVRNRPARQKWLGHVSIDTTNIYAEVDLEMKAKALAACDTGREGYERKMWHKNPRVMEFLRSL